MMVMLMPGRSQSCTLCTEPSRRQPFKGVPTGIAAWSQTVTGNREHATPVLPTGLIMPLPSDFATFIEVLADAMVADILKASSPEEVQRLIKELELRRWKLGLH
jgi:hypothetical protein